MRQILSLHHVLTTLLFLAISTISLAYDFEVDGIYYNINEDGVSVAVTYETTSYNSYSGSISIPSKVTYGETTYSVTSIGRYAFSGCSGLTSVTIPNSVTSIGHIAFSGCSGLTSVTIPNSVTSIGEVAFENCSGLTKAEFASIESLCKISFKNPSSNPLRYAKHLYINGQEVTDLVIPNSVTSIGFCAFYGCSSLTSVTIPNSVTSIGGCAFSGCSALTSISIPNSVTIIGQGAFENCSGLTKAEFASIESLCKISFSTTDANPLRYTKHLYINGQEVTDIVIPNSVTSIGYCAFYGCSSLTSVTIPNSVTSIGGCAFYGCSGLTSVIIPNSMTSIGFDAFSGCSGLTSITIPNSVISIGERAFNNCCSLTSIAVPNSVTSIGNAAFHNCSGLTSVTIGNNVTSIGSSAFYNCSSLTSVTIPNSVTSIGYSAFSGCSLLTSIDIPNSVTSIGHSAFSGTAWYNHLPDGLVYAGKVAYKYKGTMPSGTHITLDEGTLGIAGYAFEECDGLTSVTIPNSITGIGASAFSGCSGLTSVNIPNSVTSIGIDAFYACIGLTSVTIPNSVTSIGSEAFRDCSSLASIAIPNSVTSIGGHAFWGTAWFDNQPDGLIYADKVAYKYKGTMPSGTNITLYEGTLGIAGYAFQNCKGMTSVTIPNSLTSIDGYAFYSCSGLTSVTCLAKHMPNTDAYAFFSSNPENVTLYVPESAIEDYRKTAPWSSFGNIVALEAGASVANMRITDAGWATFWAPFAVDIPAGVKAYTGEMRDGWIRMIELTNGIIPGNTGVVLQLVDAEPFEIDLEPSATQPNEVVPSCYTGNTTGATMEVEIGDYLLQKNFNNERQEYVVGWYKVESPGFTLARNRCYLAKATVAELNQARPFLGFEPIDDATGISSIAAEAKTKADGKYMVNGQIVVVRAGKAYNMNGTEIK